MSPADVLMLVYKIKMAIFKYKSIRDSIVVEESHQLDYNLLNNKTNLEDYFIFVEFDKHLSISQSK